MPPRKAGTSTGRTQNWSRCHFEVADVRWWGINYQSICFKLTHDLEHVQIFIYTHADIDTYVYTYMYTSTYIYTRICICIYIYMNAQVCTFLCVYCGCTYCILIHAVYLGVGRKHCGIFCNGCNQYYQYCKLLASVWWWMFRDSWTRGLLVPAFGEWF